MFRLAGAPEAWVPRGCSPEALHVYRAVPESAGRARRDAVAAISELGRADLCERVRMVASELASNALRHGSPQGGRFAVRVARGDGAWLLDVIDRRPDRLPTCSDAMTYATGGRGLLLVAALSDEWTFFRQRVGKNRRQRVKVVRAAFL